MKAVILAGGSGTRLWPMSRRQRPKQFFDVIGSEPLICDAYRRLLQAFAPEQILFSTSPGFEHLIREHFPEVPPERILVEPERRDTGPAMGYVAALLELQDPDEPIVFIPSDHYIGDDQTFLRCLSVGDALIRETGKLLDIAIRPTFPSTVLGYTRIGESVETRDGVDVFCFTGHTEKPLLETATAYLQDGSYLWHANYYMWTPRKFMAAFERYAPDMGQTLRQIQATVRDGHPEDVSALYAALPKISLDYAVTEKMDADDVLILRGDFGWSDIGAWDTLYDRLAPEGGNVTKGSPLLLDTEGSLVYAPVGKRVAVVGMHDTVVVDTGDVLLVCPRDQAQRVKEIVSRLEAEGDIQAL